MAERIFYTMGEVAEMFDVNTSLIRHWETQFPMLRPKRNKKGNRLFTPQDVEYLKMIYHLVKECGMTLDGAKKALRKGSSAKGLERDMQLMEHLQRIRAMLVEVREDLKASEGELVDDDEDLQPVSEMVSVEASAEMPVVTPGEVPDEGSEASAIVEPEGEKLPEVSVENPVSPLHPEPDVEEASVEETSVEEAFVDGEAVEEAVVGADPVAGEPVEEACATDEPSVNEVAGEPDVKSEAAPVAGSAGTIPTMFPEMPVTEKPASEAADAHDAGLPEEGSGQPPLRTSRKPRRKRDKEEVENKELFAFYEQSLF